MSISHQHMQLQSLFKTKLNHQFVVIGVYIIEKMMMIDERFSRVYHRDK